MDIDTSRQIILLDLICGICGEAHKYSECGLIEIKRHVLDRVIPSKARSTLPNFLNLVTMADGSLCITTNSMIEKGTRFGPLEAPKLFTLNPSITFPMKLFNCGVEDLSEYYIDTTDESNCNWMIFIPSAQTVEEQNLICFQEKTEIFYVVIKDIKEGEFLKVWYSPYYAKQMKKNMLFAQTLPDDCVDNMNNNTTTLEPINLNSLVKKQQNLMKRENWTCKFCGKVESYVSLFANHILEHYRKKVVKKHCEFCEQSFTTQKKLRRHVQSKHKKELHNLTNNSKATKMSPDKIGNKDVLVGDPVLNVLLNDSLDNTNLVMPNELNQMGVTLSNTLESQNLLLESDSLNLNVDNLLTENVKELDHFNFEIGESQEQYVCDVCLKGFSKLHYLTQHLRKHTGRYTCQYCLKVFCRRENLDSHKCNNLKMPEFQCSLCSRSYMLKKYLVRHINLAHDKKHTCENCNKHYISNKEYIEHNCSAVPDSFKTTFTCVICSKKFFREIYLRKHLKVHEGRKQKLELKPTFICEICAQCFNSRKGLLTHKQTHMERTLECEICNKKFHRRETLKGHRLTHSDTQVTCTVCNAKLKTKKNLSLHMKQHTERKSHKCEICPKEFYLRSNLITHRKIHSKTCPTCNASFLTKELLLAHKAKHFKVFYECPLCNKIVKLKRSLKTHLENHHPEQDVVNIMLKIKSKSSNLEQNNISDTEDVDNEINNVFKTSSKQLCTDYINNNNNLNNEKINTNMDNISNFTSENNHNNLETIDSENLCNNNMNEQMSSNYINNENSNVGINLNNMHSLQSITSETDQENLETIVDGFENMINNYNSNNQSNLLIDGPGEMGENEDQGRILDFNNFEMDLDSNFGLQQNSSVSNEDVSLSMPDLLDMDQEITLSENAYVLEDGTIVEPKGPKGNIVIYILDKNL